MAQMGGAVVHKITLGTWEKEILRVGSNPRALALSPDDETLYVTLNASGRVIAYDLITNKVIKSVRTGNAARSLDISKDGSERQWNRRLPIGLESKSLMLLS